MCYVVNITTLMANTYGPYNGLLQLGTYGNGKTVGYTYDEFDQLIEKSYDGTGPCSSRKTCLMTSPPGISMT